MVNTTRHPGTKTDTLEGIASANPEVLSLDGQQTAEYVASLTMELYRLAVAANLDGLAAELETAFYLASALAYSPNVENDSQAGTDL